MRKALSILLAIVFGLPLLAPLVASAQSADSGIPLCCRRNGVHHCSLSAAERSRLASAESNIPTWKTPAQECPYRPASLVVSRSHDTSAPSQRYTYAVATFSHPTGKVQTESRQRIARDRSRQKRGPPSLLD